MHNSNFQLPLCSQGLLPIQASSIETTWSSSIEGLYTEEKVERFSMALAEAFAANPLWDCVSYMIEVGVDEGTYLISSAEHND